MPNAPGITLAAVKQCQQQGHFNVMREIIVVERATVTENGRTILRERKIRGLQCDDGAFRLLFYGGRRFSVPQEGSDHAKSA